MSILNFNCSNLLDMRSLQEQVKKALCHQKLLWPFTVWTNCSSDLKCFENSQPSASNFKSFSLPLQQFFVTVGQNNFGNKIPFFVGKFNLLTFQVQFGSTGIKRFSLFCGAKEVPTLFSTYYSKQIHSRAKNFLTPSRFFFVLTR